MKHRAPEQKYYQQVPQKSAQHKVARDKTARGSAAHLKARLFYKYMLPALTLLAVSLYTAAHSPLAAHFSHFEPRIIHITDIPAPATADPATKNTNTDQNTAQQNKNSVAIYLRMPLPLLLLPENWGGVDSGDGIPFTKRIKEGKDWRYFIDKAAIHQNSALLEKMIQDTHQITLNGKGDKNLIVEKLHIFSPHKRKPFSSLAYAEKALSGPAINIDTTTGEVFDTLIDLKIILPDAHINDAITLRSGLGEKLKVINRLANIVHIHRGDKTTKQVTIGVLDSAFDEGTSNIMMALNQLKSGIWHILIGLDHVLFVLLIILAAKTWQAVLRNATGFTIGHSITLTLGVLGHMPQGPWFIPSVELIIAVTIFYGAIVLILKKPELFGFSNVMMIGLIHGYGFSFVLSDVLKEGGGLDFKSILFFNLGIELGQIIIYLAAAPLIYMAGKYSLENRLDWRRAVALIAVAISLFWIIDRGTTVLAVI